MVIVYSIGIKCIYTIRIRIEKIIYKFTVNVLFLLESINSFGYTFVYLIKFS
jgi:hypothetical protein